MRIHGATNLPYELDATEAKKDEKAGPVREPGSSKEVGPGSGTDKDVAPRIEPVEGAKESVVLSPTASQKSEATNRGEAAREAQLQEVKRSIEAGEYQVDFDSLAEKLVSEEAARAERK